MNTIIVRYKVKSDRVDENVRAVQAVFAELKDKQPKGVRYATFVADDGETFFHIADLDEGVDNPVPNLNAFKEFQSGLVDRCKEKPSPTPIREVASYSFFG